MAERSLPEAAAHLLELLALFRRQDAEDIGLGLPNDNPQLGLNAVLGFCVGASLK
jgi:hypothetical protein